MSVVAGSALTFTEVDVVESGDNHGGSPIANEMHATNIWWNPYNTNDGGSFQNDYLGTGSPAVDSTGQFNDSTFHTYGWLWKTRAMNGGTGLLEFYLDDVHRPECDMTYSSSGRNSEMDAHRYIMNFVQIQGAYAAIQHIRAWA